VRDDEDKVCGGLPNLGTVVISITISMIFGNRRISTWSSLRVIKPPNRFFTPDQLCTASRYQPSLESLTESRTLKINQIQKKKKASRDFRLVDVIDFLLIRS
jgi:hypothetical protein